MNGTAQQLEEAEAILHRSAEKSPNTDTTARLHALGIRSPRKRTKSSRVEPIKHRVAALDWFHEGRARR